MDGMVEVGQSSQPVIAAAGDSGAPIFTEPVWSSANSRYEIKAAGIMHAANLYPVNPVYVGAKDPKRPCDSRYDADPCIFIYMPIDRVNDLGPLNLKVYQGSTQVFVAP